MASFRLSLAATISMSAFVVMISLGGAVAKTERPADGIYQNQFGYTLEINGKDLFYTGKWRDGNVNRKKFPFIVTPEGTFQYGAQVCESKKEAFTCHRDRDGKTWSYRFLAPLRASSSVDKKQAAPSAPSPAKEEAILKAEAEAAKARAEAIAAKNEADAAKRRVAELSARVTDEAARAQGVTAENSRLQGDLAKARAAAEAQGAKAQAAETEAARAKAEADNARNVAKVAMVAAATVQAANQSAPAAAPQVAQAPSAAPRAANPIAPPPVAGNAVNDSTAPAANHRIVDLKGQITLLEIVITEQTENRKSAPASELSAIDATIRAVQARVNVLKQEFSNLDQNFNTYLTSIKPNDRDLYLTSRRASEIYPRVPYYIPGTSETGEFWVEPKVSDRGVMEFSFQFRDVASSVEKVRGKIDMNLEQIEQTQKALYKLHEWSAVAHEQKLRRNYEKRVVCFPERECPPDGERLDGLASTEIRFNVYEDGSTAGRIQRNKGRFVEGYNVSIDSAMLLQAYLNHVIKEAKLEFRSGTQDKRALDSMFK